MPPQADACSGFGPAIDQAFCPQHSKRLPKRRARNAKLLAKFDFTGKDVAFRKFTSEDLHGQLLRERAMQSAFPRCGQELLWSPSWHRFPVRVSHAAITSCDSRYPCAVPRVAPGLILSRTIYSILFHDKVFVQWAW